MAPRLIFDTSAINALEDGGAEFSPLMRRLAWEYETVLTHINIEEILCTSCPRRRAKLMARFRRLLRRWKCLLPPYEIIQRMVAVHLESPSEFDWQVVDVGMPDHFYSMLERGEFDDEQLSKEQRNQNHDFEKGFKGVLKEVRPPLDGIDISDRPTTFEATLAQTDGFEVRFAKDLYEHQSGQTMSEEQIQNFIHACPPMNCAGLSQVMGFHRWSLRNQPAGKDPGGRNDLLAAAYLPYCRHFVTNDAAQRVELSEIARVARLECRVQALDEFQKIAA